MKPIANSRLTKTPRVYTDVGAVIFVFSQLDTTGHLIRIFLQSNEIYLLL